MYTHTRILPVSVLTVESIKQEMQDPEAWVHSWVRFAIDHFDGLRGAGHRDGTKWGRAPPPWEQIIRLTAWSVF